VEKPGKEVQGLKTAAGGDVEKLGKEVEDPLKTAAAQAEVSSCHIFLV
jgi:hypothetical protein